MTMFSPPPEMAHPAGGRTCGLVLSGVIGGALGGGGNGDGRGLPWGSLRGEGHRSTSSRVARVWPMSSLLL